MKTISFPLSSEKKCYYSNKSIIEIREQFATIFNQSQSYYNNINLTGYFIGEQHFKVYPLWTFIPIKYDEKDAAYIEGHFLEAENQNTRIEFTIRPNEVFLFLFYIFICGSILPLLIFLIFKIDLFLLISLSQLLIMPIILMGISYYVKNSLLQTFISTFDLYE